jgi:hypothetical protein
MPFVNSVTGKFGFGRPTVYRPGSLRFNSAQGHYASVVMTPIGTSTATIEFWFNADANNILQRLFSSTAISFASGDFAIRYTASAFIAGDGTAGITSSTLPSAGVWNHVAWVGTGGTSQELFLNGSRVGTGTTYNFTDPVPGYFIGGRNIGGEFFNGYISNFRYVIGTAVYSGSTYTVPTNTLEAVPGTELLLKTQYGPTVREDKSINNYTINYQGSGDGPAGSELNPFS